MKEAASREPRPSRKEISTFRIDQTGSTLSLPSFPPYARLPKFPQDAQSSIVGTWVRFHLIAPQFRRCYQVWNITISTMLVSCRYISVLYQPLKAGSEYPKFWYSDTERITIAIDTP